MLLFSLFKISGHSMEPFLKPGDKILASGIYYLLRKPQIGDIVVFRNEDLYLIKRIVKIQDNKYFLEGDNKKDSLDSRKLGPIKKEQIIARYLSKI